uniref:UBX domain-containing protein n=2 Tax=Macrostomum lignano TaxID=282301 RepID=A0A1I8JBC2_9PLAT
MSQIFTVFLPNKHRYRLEVSKSNPLYQGLEKVCIEKGYMPVHEYIFRHNKAYPDLSTPVGLLNLSSLVELELVPASEAPTKKAVTDVKSSTGIASNDAVSIALQFGAQRHIETLSCDTSLWDMIELFSTKYPSWIPPESPADQHPVLVYTRHEVPGAVALRHTSLRQIGLAPGGAPALLRLLYRPVPPEKLAAAAELAESRNRARVQPPETATSSSAAQAPPPPPSRAPTEPVTEPTATSTQASYPTTESSSSSRGAIAAESNAVNLFSPFREVPKWPETDESTRNRRPAANQAREPRTLAEALNMPDFESMAVPQAAAAAADSAEHAVIVYGPNRPFKFPEETAGQDLYRNELAEVRPAEFVACNRRLCGYVAGAPAKAVAAESAAANQASSGGEQAMELEEPDESFFHVTESDLRKLAADLKRKVEEETNGQLLTRQQRERQREDLYSCYEYTVIRLFFPDRRVVQAAFRPRETVYTLYKFVREQLLSDSAQAAGVFYLYTTPPKKEITDMAQFLIHADLVPMPIVHVGFRNSLPEGESYLKPDVLQLISSRADCDKVALDCMKSAVEPIYARQQQQQQQNRTSAASSATAGSSGPSAQRAANVVPKWFKK